uniref:UDG domain-containing protein n=1 Tax=Soboliphyme baturini TaxID=241478 RepID=A0A183J5X7_9BILA
LLQVGQQIASLKPEIIFEVTSHGVSDLRRFLFYLNSFANGSAETDYCSCTPCCYDISMPMDAQLSHRLSQELIMDGLNVSAVMFFPGSHGTDGNAVLKSAEVIPLLFIKEIYQQKKLVIFSQPSRCCDEAPSMAQELLTLGHVLYQKLDALQEKVVFVLSGELAAKHTSFGPNSAAAEDFDNHCGHWASTLHPKYLLDYAAKNAAEV